MTAGRSGLSDFLPIAVVAAALALLPTGLLLAGSTGTLLNLSITILILSLAAQGWNIAGGYGGQFSFGHAAFFGMGAYGQAVLQARFGINPWVALPLAVTLGSLVGLGIGYLAFRARLRGSYFALVTLAFAEVFRILANAAPFTGGAAGTLLPLDVRPANFQFAARETFFYLALVMVVAVLVLNRLIERSRFGAYLVAVRENEDAARSLGVDTLAVKLKAIALSAAITAASGALYTQKFLYIDANIAFGSWISVEALVAPIIGGIGTVFGPLVGTATLLGLGELAKTGIHAVFGSAIPGIDLILYGVLLVAAIAFAPQGVMGLVARFTRGGGR
jgi:branched-chain amino acid transport system permease protein